MKNRGIIHMALLMISSSLMLLGGSSTSPANAAAYTCAQGGTCAVGNVGPGGGRVFYAPGAAFTETGAACSTTCRYLESAPLTGAYGIDNVTTYQLLGFGLHNSALETSAIGSGYSNTAALVAASVSLTLAGNVARAYRGSANLSDWFLPSQAELAAYWASSPTDATTFYMASNRLATSIVIVSSGGPYYDYNTNQRPVLPIRAFAPASAPSISLSQTTLSEEAGTAVTSYSISSSGGTVGDYSISPNIAVTPSNGISFSTTTGLISGTPTAAASSVTYIITATNGGGSTTATFSISVSAGTQTITFPALAAMTIGGTAPSLSATASSGLTVSYASTTSSVCTVSGSTITVLATGTCSITASQAGNGTYAAATSVSQSFVISAVKSKDDASAKASQDKQDAIALAGIVTALGSIESSMGDLAALTLTRTACYKGKKSVKVIATKSCPKGYTSKKLKVVSGS